MLHAGQYDLGADSYCSLKTSGSSARCRTDSPQRIRAAIATLSPYERTLRFICPSFPLRLSLAMRARIFPISLRSSWRSDPGGSLRTVSSSLAAIFSRSCIYVSIRSFGVSFVAIATMIVKFPLQPFPLRHGQRPRRSKNGNTRRTGGQSLNGGHRH